MSTERDGFTTGHVYSTPHSYVILIKRGRLGGVLRCLCYLSGDKANMHVSERPLVSDLVGTRQIEIVILRHFSISHSD
jgi:hypothetical protein